MEPTDRRCGAALSDRVGAKPARASERHGFHPTSSRHCAICAVGRLRLPLVVRGPAFSQHVLLIMRAGLQILADHPRLYWGRDCTPETDWFRFQVPIPKGRIWTAKDDSVTLPTWLGIPGLRHTLGLSRWWHFSINLLWLRNGVVFLRAAVFTRGFLAQRAARAEREIAASQDSRLRAESRLGCLPARC